METKKATIKRETANTFLVLVIGSVPLEIILTDDNPNNVKSVFNDLLRELKKGPFQFELDDQTEDLFFHISKEYIKQLNVEIRSVYDELFDRDLLAV